MKAVLSRLNVPTMIAVLVIVAADRYFDATGAAFRAAGMTPKR